MRLFRHSMMRRIILLTLLSWGLLTQVATVYACEFKNGEKQISCCCDTAIKMDCADNAAPCNNPNDNTSYDSTNISTSACCNVSYGVTDASPASTSATLQLLLLDAPQPPPTLPEYQPGTVSNYAPLVALPTFTPSSPGTSTYLRTQRLRI